MQKLLSMEKVEDKVECLLKQTIKKENKNIIKMNTCLTAVCN